MSATVSSAEKRIVSSCLLSPTAYNIPLFVRFAEGLNIPKMYNLLTRYVEQFDLFRTTYQIQSEIYKRTGDEAPTIEVRTFGQLDKERLISEQLITVRDRALVRILICRVLDEPADYLFINAHHVLLDGFSMNLFLQELTEAYLSGEAAESQLHPPVLEVDGPDSEEPASIISFGSYAPFKSRLLARQCNEVHYLNDRFTLEPGYVRRHSDFAVALTAFALSLASLLHSGTVYLAYPYLGRDPRNYRALGNFVQLIPFALQLEEELETGTDQLIAGIQARIFSGFAGRDHYGELIRTEPMSSMNIFRDIIFDYKSGSLIAKKLNEAHGIELEEAAGYQDEKYGLHFSVYKSGEDWEISVISSEYRLEDLQTLQSLFRSNLRSLYASAGGGLRVGDLVSLTSREEEPPGAEDSLQAQGGEIYSQIAEIVSALLGETDVQADVSFFDLGMDSLLLVKLKKRIREAFNINLKISDFFNFHTAGLLAGKIKDHLKEAN